jgi:hypothetical protein
MAKVKCHEFSPWYYSLGQCLNPGVHLRTAPQTSLDVCLEGAYSSVRRNYPTSTCRFGAQARRYFLASHETYLGILLFRVFPIPAAELSWDVRSKFTHNFIYTSQ